jgi:ABC-type glycerol-3-phosphate transport system permease component
VAVGAVRDLDQPAFTGWVLLGTLVLGLLAGYALARLEFRGRGMVFNAMLLILIVPFQLPLGAGIKG